MCDDIFTPEELVFIKKVNDAYTVGIGVSAYIPEDAGLKRAVTLYFRKNPSKFWDMYILDKELKDKKRRLVNMIESDDDEDY